MLYEVITGINLGPERLGQALVEQDRDIFGRDLLHEIAHEAAEPVLPENVRKSSQVIPLGEALLQIHFPETQEKLEAARSRLAFDEIFYLQMA